MHLIEHKIYVGTYLYCVYAPRSNYYWHCMHLVCLPHFNFKRNVKGIDYIDYNIPMHIKPVAVNTYIIRVYDNTFIRFGQCPVQHAY